MSRRSWTVPATVVRVIDADTLELDLDLGWGITMRKPCRLLGINAPEVSTKAGRAAKAWVSDHYLPGSEGTFISRKLDKYGRPLGDFSMLGSSDLGEILVELGHAVRMSE
jgi:micrococcal nuclease